MKKNITNFPTIASYQNFLASGECPIFNVSYIEETNKNEYVIYEAPAAAKVPFYIEFINGFDPTDGGDYSFWFQVRALTKDWTTPNGYGGWGISATWEYKVDNGSWNDLKFTEINSSQNFQLSSLNGVTSSTNKIYWRLKVAPHGNQWDTDQCILCSTKFKFNFDANNIKLGGNLASLCTTREDFYNVQAVDYQYYEYFSSGMDGHTFNTDFSDVYIGVPQVAKSTYENMFKSMNSYNVVIPDLYYKGPAANTAFVAMFMEANVVNTPNIHIELTSKNEELYTDTVGHLFCNVYSSSDIDYSNVYISVQRVHQRTFLNTFNGARIQYGPTVYVEQRTADYDCYGTMFYNNRSMSSLTLLGDGWTTQAIWDGVQNGLLSVDSTKSQAEADALLSTVFPNYNDYNWTAQPLSA